MNEYKGMLSVSELMALVEKQYELNKAALGENYLEGEYKLGRKPDFLLAMKMEAAELVDSLDWKHWSKAPKELNLDNVFIEMIDILHFLLSDLIYGCYLSLNAEEKLATEIKKTILNKIEVSLANLEYVYDQNELGGDPSLIYGNMELTPCIIKYAKYLFEYRTKSVDDFYIAVKYLVYILNTKLRHNNDKILRMYKYKVALNKFRLNSDYAINKYKKYFSIDVAKGLPEIASNIITIEDNAIITSMLKYSDVNPEVEDDIIKFIKEIYTSLNKLSTGNIYSNFIGDLLKEIAMKKTPVFVSPTYYLLGGIVREITALLDKEEDGNVFIVDID